MENEIEVSGPQSGNIGAYINDTGITAAVKAKLLGQDDRDSNDITVEIIKGVVTLTGDVENQAQISLAGRLTSSAYGVKEVRNQLTVE